MRNVFRVRNRELEGVGEITVTCQIYTQIYSNIYIYIHIYFME